MSDDGQYDTGCIYLSPPFATWFTVGGTRCAGISRGYSSEISRFSSFRHSELSRQPESDIRRVLQPGVTEFTVWIINCGAYRTAIRHTGGDLWTENTRRVKIRPRGCQRPEYSPWPTSCGRCPVIGYVKRCCMQPDK